MGKTRGHVHSEFSEGNRKEDSVCVLVFSCHVMSNPNTAAYSVCPCLQVPALYRAVPTATFQVPLT